MGVPLFHVDAFTDRPFSGNPATVCMLSDYPSDEWMQGVACDMNLPETAFVVPCDGGYGLRWFTPKVEVDLCGHATLASAHTLWERGLIPVHDTIRFHTRSGILEATRSDSFIELNFPSTPAVPASAPPGLGEALGIVPRFVGRSRFDLLVEVESEQNVRALQPDLAMLRRIETRGVIVTSRADDPRFDFVSRFFAPAVGIDEDPVTGSAHCCLGPYWQSRLSKDDLLAFQASQRGGIVRVRVRGERTFLGGQAITVASGQLLV